MRKRKVYNSGEIGLIISQFYRKDTESKYKVYLIMETMIGSRWTIGQANGQLAFMV